MKNSYKIYLDSTLDTSTLKRSHFIPSFKNIVLCVLLFSCGDYYEGWNIFLYFDCMKRRRDHHLYL